MTLQGTRSATRLAFVGLVIGVACQPAFAATTTFQRGVSPSTTYTNMYDSGVSSSATSTVKANPDVVYLNYPVGTKLISYFDLSSIPAGSTVTGATLQYDFYNGSSLQAAVGLYRVRTNWLGGVAWINKGGDWADKNGTAQGSVPFATVQANFSGWFGWDMTPLVQGWVKGTWPNYGVLIKVDAATTAYGQTFASGHATTSVHPTLVVTYTPPASDTTPPTVSVTSPVAGSTINGTITVSATASDNVGVAGVQFKLDGANLGAEDTTSPYSVSWNTTTATNGAHTLTAVARDAAGNTTTSAGVTVTVDNAAPIVSSVTSSTITSSGAKATWTTNEASTSQVEYGTTTGYGQITALDSTMVTSHSVILSGLTASTLYHYRVRSKDAAGNEAVSADATLTTAPPPDTTPPTGSITINGGAVATNNVNVTLTLSATDNSSTVAQMQFSNDGVSYSSPEAYATTKTWTLLSGDGTKTVSVKFSDPAGNWSTPASDTIVLDTIAPKVSITSPADGAVITAPSP